MGRNYLAITRDLILIVAGILIILFVLQLLAGFSPLGSFIPTNTASTRDSSPEQAIALGDFRSYKFSEECVRRILGDERYNEIKSGTNILEEEKEQLAACLTQEKPRNLKDAPKGTLPGYDYGLVLSGTSCAKGSFNLTLKNLPKSKNVSSQEIEFKLNGWAVSCDGLPGIIAPGASVNCTISDFVTEGYLELQVFTEDSGSGLGAECPHTIR